MPSNMGAGMPGMDNNMRQMMQQMGLVQCSIFLVYLSLIISYRPNLVVLELVQVVDLVEPRMLLLHLMLKLVSHLS